MCSATCTQPWQRQCTLCCLQYLWLVLQLRLLLLYAASLSLGHLPRLWRVAVGMVLQKLKKPDYVCVGKSLPIDCVQEDVSKASNQWWCADWCTLRRGTSFYRQSTSAGGRVDQSITVVASIVDKIKVLWRNGNSGGVALHVAKMLPSVKTNALCWGLEKKALPCCAVAWLYLFVDGLLFRFFRFRLFPSPFALARFPSSLF